MSFGNFSCVFHRFGLLMRTARGAFALTVQAFPVCALPTVVPLVEVVIRPGLVINWIAHVHVPGVSVAELAVVPLGPVRRGVRPVIEGSAKGRRELAN